MTDRKWRVFRAAVVVEGILLAVEAVLVIALAVKVLT